MSRILARVRTPVYKNTDSVARDHLASERTFLAWLRTGLGFVALGTAIERFSQLDVAKVLPTVKSESQTSGRSRGDDSSDVLVGALLGTGSGSIIYGTARYFSTMRLLQQGLFKPAYYGVGSMGVAVAGLVGTIYYSAAKAQRAGWDRSDK